MVDKVFLLTTMKTHINLDKKKLWIVEEKRKKKKRTQQFM